MDPAPSLYDLARPEPEASPAAGRSWSLAEYLERLAADPRPARSAWQRLHAMVLSHGSTASKRPGGPARWHLFDDPLGAGRDAIEGLEEPLDRLVRTLRAGALRLGPERRLLLLHGPVGSAKSTIVRLLKTGLEAWSRTDAGALYTFEWHLDGEVHASPLRQDPLLLVPQHRRPALEAALTAALDTGEPLRIEGQLDPLSQWMLDELLARYDGSWERAMEHVRVRRVLLSEAQRVGIGTFQPRDEKSQDASELTGDVDLRRLTELGADSDPRAFRFDGEFCVANRGLLEFVEVLKLEVAFLYDLLGATQEQVVKPRKFQQVSIDQVILGHTNEPEFRRLQADPHMEAFRDRTLTIDVPYVLDPSTEAAIHARGFRAALEAGTLAPDALELAALWAVLTRIPASEEDAEAWIARARAAESDGGFEGFSPRFVGALIAQCVASPTARVEAAEVLTALEDALRRNSLVTHEELRSRGVAALSAVRQERHRQVTARVRRAAAPLAQGASELGAAYLQAAAASLEPSTAPDAPESDSVALLEQVERAAGIGPVEAREFRRLVVDHARQEQLAGSNWSPLEDERLGPALRQTHLVRLGEVLAACAGDAPSISEPEQARLRAALVGRVALQESLDPEQAAALVAEALGGAQGTEASPQRGAA